MCKFEYHEDIITAWQHVTGFLQQLLVLFDSYISDLDVIVVLSVVVCFTYILLGKYITLFLGKLTFTKLNLSSHIMRISNYNFWNAA